MQDFQAQFVQQLEVTPDYETQPKLATPSNRKTAALPWKIDKNVQFEPLPVYHLRHFLCLKKTNSLN